jgi:DNA sulfur modification protein DndC
MNSELNSLIARGAMFVGNHSGGKDSDAMLIKLRALVPAEQLYIVHADLGEEVEWEGALDHIRKYSGSLRIEVTRARRTLIEMIEERGMFPSPTLRQCTSDLKRGPIERTIRRLVQERRAAGVPGADLVVNCMGMRAAESSSRAKLEVFKRSERNSKNGREWYDWLPIHELSTDQVFETIRAAGQEPHPVYAAGMSRFSCRFCIMASAHDLRTAATLAPKHYARYVQLERTTGVVMMMPKKNGPKLTLEDITGVKADMSLLDAA